MVPKEAFVCTHFNACFDCIAVVPSGTPVNVRVTWSSSTAANVSWEPPRLADQNGLIRRYVLVLTDKRSPESNRTVSTTAMFYMFDQLKEYHPYALSVAAETISVGLHYLLNFNTLEDSELFPLMCLSYINLYRF